METRLAGSGSPPVYIISLPEYMERSPGERGEVPPYMENPPWYMKSLPASGSHPL